MFALTAWCYIPGVLVFKKKDQIKKKTGETASNEYTFGP